MRYEASCLNMGMVLEMKDTLSTTRSKQTNSKPTITV